MHVPKSGGTSLSHIFQKQLVGDVKNLLGQGGFADKTANMALSAIERDSGKKTEALHLVFRGWRDWLDVQNNLDTLHKKKTLIFEGGVWGAHSLLNDGRNYNYIFTMRDPINVFRSNFNYGMRRYSIHRSIEDYVGIYGRNLFTNILGHGCLDLAKKRLEHDISAFTVLEDFEGSIRIISDKFQFSLVNYEVKNKSGSEKIDLSEDVKRRFWENNEDDKKLYDFASELLNKRLSLLRNLGGPVKKSQKIGEGEFPKGYRNRNEEALAYLDQRDHDEAISTLETLSQKDFGVYLNLGRLYSKLGNFKKAAWNFEQACASQPNVALSELIDCYLKFDINAAEKKLIDEMSGLKKIQNVDYFDSLPNRELIAISEKLTSILIKNKKWKRAHYISSACLKLIGSYPLNSWQNTQSARSYKRILVILIRLSFKIGDFTASRRYLYDYRTLDFGLNEVSLSSNKILFFIAPILCSGLVWNRITGSRVSN